MTESFITALNGVITSTQHGDISNDYFDTPYYGHEKIKVPFEALAVIRTFDKIEFYTPDWQRKSGCRLIKEGLLPMPEGYVDEGDELRPMTREERVVNGLDEPPAGCKVVKGEIVPMTLSEQVEAGQVTQAEYERHLAAANENELRARLAALQTPEAVAEAETDEEYAAERRAKLAALLAVRKQEGWPLAVEWPAADGTGGTRA